MDILLDVDLRKLRTFVLKGKITTVKHDHSDAIALPRAPDIERRQVDLKNRDNLSDQLVITRYQARGRANVPLHVGGNLLPFTSQKLT